MTTPAGPEISATRPAVAPAMGARAAPWPRRLVTRVYGGLERLSSFRYGALLALILAIPHALGVVFAVRILESGRFFGGSPGYARVARQLFANGFWTPESFTAYRPPLYPLFLYVHQVLFPGHAPAVATAVQGLVSMGAGLLLGLAVARLTRDRLAGLLAAALLATDVPYLNEALYQVETVFFVLLVIACFAALARGNGSGVAIAAVSALAGLGHLTRPTGVLLLVVLAWPLAARARRGLPSLARGVALAVLPFTLLVLPWQLAIQRNLGMRTAMSSTTGGENLFKGNNPDILTMVPYVWLDDYEPWIQRALHEASTSPMAEVERHHLLTRLAVDFMRANPDVVLQGFWVKLLALHSPRPTPLGKADLESDARGRVRLAGYRAVETPLVSLKTLHWWVVLAGAALFLLWPPARRRVPRGLIRAGLAFCLVLSVVQAATIPYTRYRLAMDPLIIAAASVAMATALRRRTLDAPGR